ncbi:RDD family protein [Marinifilum flexuosum]|uniref:Putative RDD family membrane protein YckC n=1 Tax=Marinifilum flexuosum TaxID=1117708 RepID=A0A419X823_9BACT|nr:RDD family protein [Marinifilum flexuosum]RKE03852.1 putative RDD family membrane protein YckC [Marinifilum flexuosum]
MINQPERVNAGLRLASMLVDHFIMTFVCMLIAVPGIFIAMFDVFTIDHEPTDIFMGSASFMFFVGFSAYFNKDIFNGRSAAKRILKLQVVDIKTGKAANPLKCFVRNIPIVFWPLEAVFVLANPKRRLGDFIAGTRIEYVEHPEKNRMDWPKFTISVFIAIGFSFLMSLPFSYLSSMHETEKTPYVIESLNNQKSEEANAVFTTQLNDLIKEADFKIYDNIHGEERGYVAGILYFKYREDYEDFEQSESQIKELLAKKYPLEQYCCFIKFVYKESGSLNTRQRFYK